MLHMGGTHAHTHGIMARFYVLLKIITGPNYLFLDPIFITLHYINVTSVCV